MTRTDAIAISAFAVLIAVAVIGLFMLCTIWNTRNQAANDAPGPPHSTNFSIDPSNGF